MKVVLLGLLFLKEVAAAREALQDCIPLVAGDAPRDFVLTLPNEDVSVLPAQAILPEVPVDHDHDAFGDNIVPVDHDHDLGDNSHAGPSVPDNLLDPCFTVVGEPGQGFRLTIRTYDYHTRFALSEEIVDHVAHGYAWGGTADGIYYCIPGNKSFAFWDEIEAARWLNESRPVGSTVTISSNGVDGQCHSESIGFDGIIKPPSNYNASPPNASAANATFGAPFVFWSDHRYFLKAQSFEYTVLGETRVTMEGATDIQISGDPGSGSYHSIEITWFSQEGKQKRLFIYVDANDQGVWSIKEFRVYNDQEDWEYFFPTNWNGTKATCFQKDTFVLQNGRGSQIAFANLTLATFRPWSNETAFLDCIDGMKIVLEIGSEASVTSLAAAFGVLPSQIELHTSTGGSLGMQAIISGRDRNDLSCIHKRMLTGKSDLSFVIVTSSGNPLSCVDEADGYTEIDTEIADSPSAMTNSYFSMFLMVSMLGFLML